MRKKRFILIAISIAALIIILTVVFFVIPKTVFDNTVLDTGAIYSSIETFTGEPFYGRLTGSSENELLTEYIKDEFESLGLVPAGVDNTYYQPFSTVSAQIDNSSTFNITIDNGETINLVLYKDYSLLPGNNGGGVDFSGEIILLYDDIYSAEKEDIENRIVVVESDNLDTDMIDYVISNDGRGIFCCADYSGDNSLKRIEQQKNLSSAGKTGQSIAIGYLSKEIYELLLNSAVNAEEPEAPNIIHNVQLKTQISYPIAETANILGKIEGSSKDSDIIILSANIDGAGYGPNGMYFEGAVRNASGVAVLLEIARVLSEQELTPSNTIVFMCFNGQEQDYSGSNYYAENPIFPLEKTTLLHIETAGAETKNGLLIASDKTAEDTSLRDTIIDYSEAAGLMVGRSAADESAINALSEKGVSAVQLSDEYLTYNTYDDTVEKVDEAYLRNASLVILDYIELTSYAANSENNVTAWEKFVTVVSKPVIFIKNIFDSGTDSLSSVKENSQIITGSVWKSLKLIITGLLLSLIFGMFSGLFSGFMVKKRNTKSLIPLIGLSIPDVFIIIIGWRISALYGMHLPKLEEALPISSFLMPLITISILPIVYISRITFITLQEEMKKDYLRNSKAKGYSKKRILFSELFPAAMFKIVDALPTIMTMLIGNLIIAELLYNYHGAAYYLIYFYNNKAYYETFVCILTLGLIYTVFSWLLQLIAKSFNPIKSEVVK